MKKLKLKFAIQLALIIAFLMRPLQRRGSVALANAAFPGQLGVFYPDGRINLTVDSSVSLPVVNRYLGWSFKTDQLHGRPWNGTTDLPLGISPDAPSSTIISTALQLAVYLFGQAKGTMIGIAAGAITHGNYVVAAPNGQIADLTLQANGNYWVVGTALGDTTAVGAEASFLHRVPMQVTVTTGAISAILQ